jgi:hypothetical protein
MLPYEHLKSVFVEVVGSIADKLKGGVAGAFAKFGAKISLEAAEFAAGDEMTGWIQKNIGEHRRRTSPSRPASRARSRAG